LALERAVKRIGTTQVGAMLSVAARVDALAKGLTEGSPWDALMSLALAVAGKPVASGLPATIDVFQAR
jgi:hypothetical protein